VSGAGVEVDREGGAQVGENGGLDRAVLADLVLFSIAVVWGFNFVVIKDAIERVDPMVYVALRYLVALAIFALAVPRSVTRTRRSDWWMGAVLGVFYLTALIVQTVGLQYTTPGKSSFITGLNVAMVPFLYWLVARRSPGWVQVGGAAVATVGLGVLSLRGDLTLGWGDSLALLGAFFYALHIMATGFFAPRMRPATLAVLQILWSAVLALAVVPFVADFTLALPWQAWAAIVWTAVSGTVYAFFAQSWAQRFTSSTHAAVLLCLESVFGAVFGVMFGMDSVTWRLIGGAGLIFTGILVIEVVPGLLRGPGRASGTQTGVVTPGDALEPLGGGPTVPRSRVD
jgi:drug/metabolite transporter (DMT)-like permease